MSQRRPAVCGLLPADRGVHRACAHLRPGAAHPLRQPRRPLALSLRIALELLAALLPAPLARSEHRGGRRERLGERGLVTAMGSVMRVDGGARTCACPREGRFLVFSSVDQVPLAPCCSLVSLSVCLWPHGGSAGCCMDSCGAILGEDVQRSCFDPKRVSVRRLVARWAPSSRGRRVVAGTTVCSFRNRMGKPRSHIAARPQGFHAHPRQAVGVCPGARPSSSLTLELLAAVQLLS